MEAFLGRDNNYASWPDWALFRARSEPFGCLLEIAMCDPGTDTSKTEGALLRLPHAVLDQLIVWLLDQDPEADQPRQRPVLNALRYIDHVAGTECIVYCTANQLGEPRLSICRKGGAPTIDLTPAEAVTLGRLLQAVRNASR